MARLNHSRDPIVLQAMVGRKTVRALHKSGKIHYAAGRGHKAAKLRDNSLTVAQVAEAWKGMFRNGYKTYEYDEQERATKEISRPVRIEILDDLDGRMIFEA